MSCAVPTLKFTAFLMNVLLCLFGGLMLSASAYALVTFSACESVRIPCIIGIVIGGALFLTTFLGCCGTLRESVRLTWIYSVCVLLLLGSQLVVIFLLPIDYTKLANETATYVWQQQFHDSNLMSDYEIKYGCCGVNGPDDYTQSGLKVPPSCYMNQNATIAADLLTIGCASRLSTEFKESARIELISNWTLVGVEALTILVASLLAVNLQNMKRRRLY